MYSEYAVLGNEDIHLLILVVRLLATHQKMPVFNPSSDIDVVALRILF